MVNPIQEARRDLASAFLNLKAAIVREGIVSPEGPSEGQHPQSWEKAPRNQQKKEHQNHHHHLSMVVSAPSAEAIKG